MKRLFVFAVLGLGLLSCSDDDDSSMDPVVDPDPIETVYSVQYKYKGNISKVDLSYTNRNSLGAIEEDTEVFTNDTTWVKTVNGFKKGDEVSFKAKIDVKAGEKIYRELVITGTGGDTISSDTLSHDVVWGSLDTVLVLPPTLSKVLN